VGNVIEFADICEANGHTIRQNNMDMKHNIPLGSLVEIVTPEMGDWLGIRLYVTDRGRDCDGTPLYSLGSKGEDNKLLMHHGFEEGSFKRV